MNRPPQPQPGCVSRPRDRWHRRLVYAPALAALVLLAASAAPAAAQRVKGRVADAATGAPVHGAFVALVDILADVRRFDARVASDALWSADAGLRTTDFSPRFADDVPFHYDFVAFRGPGRRTDLSAIVAVPAGRLVPTAETDAAVYRLRLTLTVYDSIRGRHESADTTLRLRATRSLQDSELISVHVRLHALPSPDAGYRITVRDANRAAAGRGYGGALSMPDFSHPGLALSGLMVALPDAGGPWRRGEVALSPIPTATVGENGEFALFYEVYGLAPGEAYRTEIAVLPLEPRGLFGRIAGLFGDDPAAVRMRFEGVAPADLAGALQELRRVGAPLEPGRYRLTVTVTAAANGESVSREREFEVTATEGDR